MEHLYLGIELRYTEQAINDRITEIGALHEGLHGVVIGDDEFAEKRLARGDDHGDMIQTGAFPHRVRLLPLPCIVIHTTKFSLPQRCDYFSNFGAKVRKNPHILKSKMQIYMKCRQLDGVIQRREIVRAWECRQLADVIRRAEMEMSSTRRRNAKKGDCAGVGISSTRRRNSKKKQRTSAPRDII